MKKRSDCRTRADWRGGVVHVGKPKQKAASPSRIVCGLVAMAVALAFMVSTRPGWAGQSAFYSIAADDGWVLSGGSINATKTGTDGVRMGDSAANEQYKDILSFSASGIPTGAVITAAKLALKRGCINNSNPYGWAGTCQIEVKQGLFGAEALEAGDYTATSNYTNSATIADPGTNDKWTTTTLDSAALAYINTTGFTQFRLHFSGTTNNNSMGDYMGFYAGEAGQGTGAPCLSITWDRPPTDLSVSPSSVPENQPSGTTLGTFSSTDPDSGQTFSYSLVSGTGSGDNGSFTIASGALKTAASFDYETKNSYSIRVQTTDQDGLTSQKALTITVTDANDVPTNLSVSPSSVA
jgi:hypothetical protein